MMVAGRANVVGTAFSRKMLIIFACATCAAIYLFRSPTTETGLQSFIGLNQNSPAQLFGANTDETSRGCRAPYAPIGFVPNKQEFLYKQLRREFRLALIDVDGKSGQAALKCWSEAGLSDDGKKCAYNDGWSHFSVEHLLGEALRTHPVTKMIPSKQELKEASFTDPYWRTIDIFFIHSFQLKPKPTNYPDFATLAPQLWKDTHGRNFASVNLWKRAPYGITLTEHGHQTPTGYRNAFRADRNTFVNHVRELIVPYGHVEDYLNSPDEILLEPSRKRKYAVWFLGSAVRGKANGGERAQMLEAGSHYFAVERQFAAADLTGTEVFLPAVDAVHTAKDEHGNAMIGAVGITMQDTFEATFCLCPAGDSDVARRFFTSILAGCIPVVMSQHIVLPFESLIDYSTFVVFVAFDDTENAEKNILPTVGDKDEGSTVLRVSNFESVYDALLHMTEEEVLARRRNLLCVRDHFVYRREPGGHPGDAVDTIVAEMALNALDFRRFRRWFQLQH
mmetsp:Transcript_31974/g.71755  ORF Transcript_31974/g.71755 Transcript_31974/m.71755 type:complete len:506 (-) Transcript_31974:81-1598(-)